MRYIWDKERRIGIINGYIDAVDAVLLLSIPYEDHALAEKIIHVYRDENDKYIFKILKARCEPRGEFTPTREEFNYITIQLLKGGS